MTKWIHRLAALALSTAGVAHATPVEDFARGTTLDVRRVAASLHITAPFTDERRTAMTSDEQCFSKVAGSHDIDMNLAAIGLPVTVRFTGTPIGADRLRFTVDQVLNQCVVIDGSERRIKRISGTLNARLNMFVDPHVGRCASDLAQNLQVAGGGESDTENRLHITVDSGCGDFTVGGDVVVHDIVLDGLSGRFPVEPPVAVAEFSNERTFICPKSARWPRPPWPG